MMYRNRHSKHGAGVHIFVEQDETGRGRHRGRGMRQGHGMGKGFGRGRGGRGRRRPLDHGDLRLLLLKLISEAPRHGYDLIREIEARTGGAYVPSPGVIYPALEALLDLGWVQAEAEGSRRSFRLTEAGEAQLAAEAETLERIEARLASLLESDRPEDPMDVRGAMWRLRHAVIAAVRTSPDDPDRRKAVADILAEAQARIAGLDGNDD